MGAVPSHDWLVNCCWSSAAQWFMVPSHTGLMLIFYCLKTLRTFRLLTASTRLWLSTQSQSQNFFTTVSLPPISASWRQAPWDSRPTFFQLNTCFHNPYGSSCNLQLLLVLISAVILRSDSRGIRDHILLPQIRDSPNLEGQVPVFISPRNRVA
jgi:hypothetical protein